MSPRLGSLLLIMGLVGWGQTMPTPPPRFFEFQIPEFGDRVFDSDVIELPVENLSRIVIHLLNPMAESVPYSKIFTKLNGIAAATICQNRSTSRGKAIHMDLKMRPHLRLQPGANTIEVIARNDRGRLYYKNYILRTREHSRNEWFAYDVSASSNDEMASPPDVLLAEPEFPLVFQPGEKPRRIRIKGRIGGVHPVARLSINSSAWPFPPGRAEVEFEQEITVSSKDQQIAVEAWDQKGNRTRVTVPVMVTSSGAPLKFSGDRYAVVIGVSRYGARPGGPPDLPAASADAQTVAEMLTSKAGFAAQHVLVLRDDRAGCAQIRNAFRNFVAKAKPDDLLFVYLAGHGLHDPGSPDKIYLAAYDTQIRQLSETALSFSEVEQLLGDNVRSRNVVLVFDVGRPVGSEWAFAGGNLVNAYLLQLFSQEKGRAVLVSGGVNEISRERGSQGVFARWMVEALEGKADWNHDRVVTVAEMFRYVAEKVRVETNGTQSPHYQIAQESLRLANAGN